MTTCTPCVACQWIPLGHSADHAKWLAAFTDVRTFVYAPLRKAIVEALVEVTQVRCGHRTLSSCPLLPPPLRNVV